MAVQLVPAKYGEKMDILLLREMLAMKIHPAAKGKRAIEQWEAIVERINRKISADGGKFVTVRQTRDRAKVLYTNHQKSERESELASGVDEDVTELTTLLTELMSLLNDGLLEKLAVSDKKKEDQLKEAQGFLIRKKAMESLKPKPNPKPQNEEEDEDIEDQEEAVEDVDLEWQETPVKKRKSATPTPGGST
jgi:hypothetical protein